MCCFVPRAEFTAGFLDLLGLTKAVWGLCWCQCCFETDQLLGRRAFSVMVLSLLWTYFSQQGGASFLGETTCLQKTSCGGDRQQLSTGIPRWAGGCLSARFTLRDLGAKSFQI